MNKVSYNHGSCGLDFFALLVDRLFFLNWFELALLDFVLEVVQFGDGSTEAMEDEGDEQGRAGQHEVALGHVKLAVVSIQLQVVLFVFGAYQVEVVQCEVFQVSGACIYKLLPRSRFCFRP